MKVTKPLKNGGRKLAFAFACALAGLASCVAVADDLTVAAGESLTITDNRTYGTITVNGDLTISGSGASVTATTMRVAEGAKMTSVLTVKDGASLTVTGERNDNYYPFTVSHASGTGNSTGTVNVVNGATLTREHGKLRIELLHCRAERLQRDHDGASLLLDGAQRDLPKLQGRLVPGDDYALGGRAS